MVSIPLYEFYEKEVRRKLKWYSFINKQRSEANMINRFKKKFGNENEVVIAYGDYSRASTLKYHEPTKGISMRRVFTRVGYKLYLINEFRTSKMCFLNGEEMETYKKVRNPRPYRKGNITRHGLLRLKNVPKNKSLEKLLLNRDLNGSMNILKIAKCIMEGKDRPSYLTK